MNGPDWRVKWPTVPFEVPVFKFNPGSEIFACPDCGSIWESPEPRLCPECDGKALLYQANPWLW